MTLLHDLVTLLFDIYSKDSSYCRGTCTYIFVAALFTIFKKYQQTKCPTTNGQIIQNVGNLQNGVVFLNSSNSGSLE